MKSFLIGYSICTILLIICIIIEHKINFKEWNLQPTIGNLITENWSIILMSFIPVVQVVFLIGISGHLIWDAIKNIEI